MAWCGCTKHGKCTLTRSSAAATGKGASVRDAQGRPLGLLTAWLGRTHHKDVKSKESHEVSLFCIDRAERLAGREELMMQAGGAQLAQRERRSRKDEPEEPVDTP